MHCENCGALIDPQSKFCGECGNSLWEKPPEERGPSSIARHKARKSSTKLITVFLICISIALLALIGFWSLFSRDRIGGARKIHQLARGVTEGIPDTAQKDTVLERKAEASTARMRLLFYGYVNKQPKSGIATISLDGISGIADVNFLHAGGEISRDGRLVAFDSCNSPNRGIYIANIDGTAVRMVVPLSGDFCILGLRWSPDDKKLSYASPTDRFLHVIQIDTKIDTPMSETSSAGLHSWSPAGDKIVYENGYGGSRLLYIIDMKGIIRQLTYSKDFKKCETWAPDWSSDGSQIAFTSCDKKLFLIAPDGTGLQQVASISDAYSPRWSIDGNWIFYLSGATLMRVRRNGESLMTVGELPYSGGPFSLGPLR